MKRIFCVMPAVLMMVCLLCGCSFFEEKIKELGETVIVKAQQIMDEKEAQEQLENVQDTATDVIGEEKIQQSVVRVVSDSEEEPKDDVVMTLDYMGIAQVHTFTFTNGTLSSAVVTMVCSDSTQLYNGREFFTTANEEQEMYININTDGSTLTAEYSSVALEPYRGQSQDGLVELLSSQFLG